ncbi:MAG: DNA alkylation response protein, partial [Deltaproteobacteria bacterium]
CNWYEVDPNLQFLMDRLLEQGDREFAETWLKRWGALCGGPIAERAERTDRHPPILERYDRWGEEIDRVEHDPAAIATKRDLWNAGFNGLPYSEVAKERGRPVPAPLMTAFSYLLAQAETGMLCAVGMTPAVAHLIERHGSEELKARFLPHLRAMNFEDAWDGSMFLTEKTGGSDLGTVSTVARPNGDHWLLEGTKWFCSNVDGMVIATLARPEGGKPGIKGVAAFIVPRFRSDGTRNGLRIRRIKEKLGTRAVPTAEVDFVDAEAYLLGDDPFDGKGINRAMEMVNISRAGVGVMGAGIARRSFLEAAIFAANREAFGRTLTDWPILRKDLLAIQLASESAAALIFEVARLTHLHDHLGDEEAGRLLRILTPLVKLRATRQGLTAASAALEVLGGNGYIENWPMARQLRDAQCHT